MPTITGTKINTNSAKVSVQTWTPLANGDDGSALYCAAYAEKSVQVVGTFGAGGSVTLQGSNDGSNWAALKDPFGDALTFTAAGIAMVLEATQYVRPIVTAGDGTTSLTVTLMIKE